MKAINIVCTCGHVTSICGIYYTHDYNLKIMTFCSHCHALCAYTVSLETIINRCQEVPKPEPAATEISEYDLKLLKEAHIVLDTDKPPTLPGD